MTCRKHDRARLSEPIVITGEHKDRLKCRSMAPNASDREAPYRGHVG
jgi:hypothetical protein